MITEFGKQLRVIRIKNDELMLDMAKKLKVTPSYLSAVENGKRNIPNEWPDVIGQLYKLSKLELSDLITAAERSKDSIQINLLKASEEQKDFALALAREFENLDKGTIKKLQESLKSCRKEKKKRDV